MFVRDSFVGGEVLVLGVNARSYTHTPSMSHWDGLRMSGFTILEGTEHRVGKERTKIRREVREEE